MTIVPRDVELIKTIRQAFQEQICEEKTNISPILILYYRPVWVAVLYVGLGLKPRPGYDDKNVLL